MSPSLNFFHQELIVALIVSIGEYLRGNPIGKVIAAPSDVQLDGGNVYHLDVFFIRTERLALVDDHAIKGAPDLVVEVISGSTGRLDLGPKKQCYAASGVTEFWAVHPHERRVEIFRLQDSKTEPARVLGRGDTLSTPLLPGWSLAISELFGR